jgi:thymidylate synthase (FAD)
MEIIKQKVDILVCPENPLIDIERAARICYKSEDKITTGSAEKLVKNLIDRDHGAMLEFADVTVKFTTNRGISHELVRHRLCSFAQESTRYVKYDGGMEFIEPVWWVESSKDAQQVWTKANKYAEYSYKQLRDLGWQPQQARDVLPIDIKTEIVTKGNLREWRHIFSLRCAKPAHPQMRDIMLKLLCELRGRIPIIFDDLTFD